MECSKRPKGEKVVCAAAYRNYVTFPFLQLVPYTLIQKKKMCGSFLISKRGKTPKWLIKYYPINNFSSAGKVLFKILIWVNCSWLLFFFWFSKRQNKIHTLSPREKPPSR